MLGAAENSLPGDALYGVKRLSENARGTIMGQQFGNRREDEIRILLALKREADVDFTGKVDQIDGADWHVAALDLQVGAATNGAATATVGDTVHVTAHTTAQGELIALRITVLEKGVVPTPSATPSPMPTLTTTNLPASVLPTLTRTPPQTQTFTTPAPTVCTPTMPSGWVRYVIQSGDLVTLLAQKTGASVTQLIAVNCLPETQTIIVGQPLFLPILPPATLIPTQSPTIAPTPTNAPAQSGAQPTDDRGGSHGGGGSDG